MNFFLSTSATDPVRNSFFRVSECYAIIRFHGRPQGPVCGRFDLRGRTHRINDDDLLPNSMLICESKHPFERRAHQNDFHAGSSIGTSSFFWGGGVRLSDSVYTLVAEIF